MKRSLWQAIGIVVAIILIAFALVLLIDLIGAAELMR
jgi:hypothetical protein